MRVRIASRKSDLARLQSYRVGEALKAAHPDLEIEYHFRSSLGDLNQTDPLWKMPEKGVFTEDFLEGLKTDEFDLVVHSWKDLPTEERQDTELIATLPRADQRDLILFRKECLGQTDLKHWRILSSSPRREYNLTPFLKNYLPNSPASLEFLPVRGNINTRLRKLSEGQGEALVVAKAALDRLLLAPEEEFAESQTEIRQILSQCQWMVVPLSISPTAAAQGAIVVEAKKGRDDLRQLFKLIDSVDDFAAVVAERRRLAAYGGGCHLKIGISICLRNSQAFLFSRGLTPEGESFEVQTRLGAKETSQPKAKAWPVGENGGRVFTRESTNLDPQALSSYGGVLVARVGPGLEELSERLKGKVIWAAGSKTWAKLAALGIWVNGSLDGLGGAVSQVDHLTQHQVSWVKLTHEASAAVSEEPALGYYTLKPKNHIHWEQELSGKEAFFWNSYSLFEEAKSHYPALVHGRHACGPGQTATRLKAALGHDAVDVYLSHEEWLKSLC